MNLGTIAPRDVQQGVTAIFYMSSSVWMTVMPSLWDQPDLLMETMPSLYHQ